MFIDIAECLAAAGTPAVLFDYRGSGYSDLHFHEMTLYSELEDLATVLSFVRHTQAPRIIVWAMSLGTAIAAKQAHLAPHTLDALILWGSAADLHRNWPQRYEEALRLGHGETVIDSGFKITSRLIASVKDFDLAADLRSASQPLLMVHGTKDEAIDIAIVTRAMNSLGRNFDRVVLEGGNHGFHNQPELYEHAIELTVAWIRQFNESHLPPPGGHRDPSPAPVNHRTTTTEKETQLSWQHNHE